MRIIRNSLDGARAALLGLSKSGLVAKRRAGDTLPQP